MSIWLAYIFRPIRWAVSIWVAGCFVAFLLGFVLEFTGSPAWLDLPWSDANDFVVTSQGDMCVHVSFYNRLLRYDRSGRFLYSYEAPEKATVAIDDRDRIYFLEYDRVQVHDLSNWSAVDSISGGAPGAWLLGPDRRPLYSKLSTLSTCPGPVIPGGVLFQSYNHTRRVFPLTDGSEVRWRPSWLGPVLERFSPDGTLTATCTTPWYLRPFVFPFPAALPWGLFMLSAIYDAIRETLSKKRARPLSPR